LEAGTTAVLKRLGYKSQDFSLEVALADRRTLQFETSGINGETAAGALPGSSLISSLEPKFS